MIRSRSLEVCIFYLEYVDDFDFVMGNALAPQRLEGREVPQFCQDLIASCLRDEMTFEQALQIITDRVRSGQYV